MARGYTGWNPFKQDPVTWITDNAKVLGRQTGNWLTNQDQQNELKDIEEEQKKIEGENIAFQKEMYNQNRADLMPWMESSKKYLGQMGELYDQGAFNMPNEDLEGPAFQFDMQMDPGYQFRMDRAMNALKSANSARGNRLSGGSMAGLMDRAQGVASDEYSNAYNRAYGKYGDEYNRRGNAYNRRASNMANQFNMLSGMGGMGAAQQAVGAGQNYASGMGNIFANQGANAANLGGARMQMMQNSLTNPSVLLPMLVQGGGMLMGGMKPRFGQGGYTPMNQGLPVA
jgi:Zn-finger nucleic acid-binding protein